MYRIYKLTKPNSMGFIFLRDDYAACNNFEEYTFPINMDFNDITLKCNVSTFTGPNTMKIEPNSGHYIRRYLYKPGKIDTTIVYYFKRFVDVRRLYEVYDTYVELIYENEYISDELLKEKLPECYY